ncbi:hypothetical protein EPUS_02254 [Endocarpon pusillum Z07020]|uniref:Uncharacterized protein n=1 Tax=Endocarpon pusillum (strain Z07020 / HMAS-L-300199) TaxID=1263415 RepID=U1I0I8_ENDPU|nr:uncharacterized protein EPUS_02254 [Endocarpon pusillum Z07020]ERF76715.1 hypothetical protein EPUS_02254 [Endocarpon pusillum Z07020]
MSTGSLTISGVLSQKFRDSEKNAVFAGQPSSEIETILGYLLYAVCYLPTISHLEKQGRDRYDQIIPILKELQKPTAFNTKRYQINIVPNTSLRDCTVIVVSINRPVDELKMDDEDWLNGPSSFVVSELNDVDWDIEKFDEYAVQLHRYIASLSPRMKKLVGQPSCTNLELTSSGIIVVPTDARNGGVNNDDLDETVSVLRAAIVPELPTRPVWIAGVTRIIHSLAIHQLPLFDCGILLFLVHNY